MVGPRRTWSWALQKPHPLNFLFKKGVPVALGGVGNVLHPVTPENDPVGVARVIADSDIWAPVHLVIVLGIAHMLGGLVAVYHSIRGGLPGALARFGLFAAVAGATIGLVLVILDGSLRDSSPRSGRARLPVERPPRSAWSMSTRPSTSRWRASLTSSSRPRRSSCSAWRWCSAACTRDGSAESSSLRGSVRSARA